MKAEIKPSGTLKISSENELEAYALRVWAESQQKSERKGLTDFTDFIKSDNLLIDYSFPVKF